MPHQHAGVYAMGLLSGYYLARTRNLAFSWYVHIVGWILSLASSSAVVFGTLGWNRGQPYGPAESVFYAALFRHVWALSLTWMTLMCANGTGGFVNRILSWPVLKPLGKLSYLVYLLHFPVMYFYVAGLTGSIELDHKTMLWTFSGHLVVTLFAAALFYLLFEGPLTNLERLFTSSFFRKRKAAKQKETSCTESKNQDVPENEFNGTISCRL